MVAQITDKALLRRKLARAHKRADPQAAFLVDRIVADLGERLNGVERRFPLAMAHCGQSDALASALARSGKADTVLRLEAVAAALRGGTFQGAVGDEESLPLKPGSIDLFVSSLALQWTNDLPGALIQIRQALRPDGLFLAAMAGGETLSELRAALLAAETEIGGGASLRVMPSADVRDVGALLQRAGFALPVADRDRLTIRYDNLFALFADLKAMGATSVLAERRPAPRRLFLRAAEIYAERFSDADGRIRATFETISLSGWAPHESQQKPARRGSGEISLTEALRRQKER